jgi:putative transposase
MSERAARTDVESRREVGLFRYALVRDAADPGLSTRERGRLVRALADRVHVGPDGRLVRVARGTLDQWIRAYRHGGFEALVPQPRVVPLRTPAGMLELAFQVKRERPERTAAQVRQIMLATATAGAGDHVPGLRTMQTHFARQGLNARADGRTPGKVYGRFEASARNELWTGDGLHGPKLDGNTARRAVLLAFIETVASYCASVGRVLGSASKLWGVHDALAALSLDLRRERDA